MPSTHTFTVFADYFQFVLMDEESEDDFSEIWTDEALRRMLAVGKNAVCPGTLRNVDVQVAVITCQDEPKLDLTAYDHAAEASLRLPSGKLVVMGCSGYLPDAPRIEVSAGTFRVLFVASGLDSITAEWEAAEDKYIVYLWPGESREPKLLKHWKRSA